MLWSILGSQRGLFTTKARHPKGAPGVCLSGGVGRYPWMTLATSLPHSRPRVMAKPRDTPGIGVTYS